MVTAMLLLRSTTVFPTVARKLTVTSTPFYQFVFRCNRIELIGREGMLRDTTVAWREKETTSTRRRICLRLSRQKWIPAEDHFVTIGFFERTRWLCCHAVYFRSFS
jgi:hypothetical protein